jgi:FG-GAP repeat
MKSYLSFVKSLAFFFVWIPFSWCQASPGTPSAVTPIVLSSSIKQIATLTSSDESLGDGFGGQVLADPSTAVVGAAATPGSCGWGGSIYVFVKPESGWQNMTQTAELTANNSCLMALMDFKDDTIVGGQESCTGNGNFGPGALYVWVKPSSGWTDRYPDATLLDGSPGCVDTFAAGAVMNDTQDIILGSGGANQQVFVFAKPAGGWANMSKPTAVIKAPQGSSQFGASMVIRGNILAVSAPDTAPNGAVYVFQIGAGGKVTQLAVLTLTAADGPYTGVGDSLAMTDDTIVAGAPLYNNDQGAVYVFSKPSSGWTNMTETARLTVNNAPSDYPVFGSSVAFDPTRQFIIGGFDSVGFPAPIAYLFRSPASGWQTTDTPTAGIFANGKGSSEIAANSDYFVVTDIAISDSLGAAFVFAP